MKKSALILAVMGLFVAAGVHATEAEKPMAPNFSDAFAKAFNSGDMDALANSYDTDAVVAPWGDKPFKGKDKVKEYFTEAKTKKGFDKIVVQDLVVSVAGEYASTTGTYSLWKKGGELGDHGYWITYLQYKDGKWQAVFDTWASQIPTVQVKPEGIHFSTDWAQSYSAADMDLVASLHDDEVIVAPWGGTSSGPLIHGGEELKKYYLSIHGFAPKAVQTDQNYFVSEDGKSANTVANYAIWKDGVLLGSGIAITYLELQDGKWKAVVDTWNSLIPPAPAKSE